MKIINKTILALAMLVLGLNIAGCSIPGASGHGRYKTEVLSTLSAIENDINGKGNIQQKNVDKLEGVLEKWRDEYGKKGSFIRAEEVLELCKKSVAGEDTFSTNQSIKLTNDSVRSYFQTEGS